MNSIRQLRLKTNIHVLNKIREVVLNAFKDKKKRRIIIIATLGVLVPVTIFSIIRATRVKADWFDDSYNQRQKVSFSHTSDISSERRISITVNTQTLIADGKMQTDCDDTIFTSVGGKLLKYTLVSGCNTTSTVYDVVVDSVTNGGNNLFMYYSNPIAHSTIDGAVSSVTSLSPSGAPSVGSEEIGPSPSMYLKFDEADGGTAHDSTSNQNNATLGDPAIPDQKLRQEINIIDHVAAAAGDDPSLVQLDTTKYSGTVTYYFEVVAQVASGTLTVALERAGTSTQDSTITVTETAFTRKRSVTAFTPPSGTTEYNINLANGTTPQVKSARILVFQNIGKTALTSTETQFEIGNYEVGKSNPTASSAPLNSPKYWTYTAANWDGTKTFSAEVTYKNSGASGVQTWSAAGSGTWTGPSGVQFLKVEAWGGGGGGGGQNLGSDGGGGGGGGGYSRTDSLSVVPGTSYNYSVGVGGTGGTSGAGTSGGNTYFVNATTVMAQGGRGGVNSTGTPPAGGLGGSSSVGYGAVKFQGGQGEIGRNASQGQGGYGGSSGGNAANGWSGPQTWSTITYPTGSTPAGAGHGGNGGDVGANGSAPASGNGGGGGGSGDGTARTGGNGAPGKLVLTWTIATTIILQEDNGSFGGWTNKQTIVSSGASTSATRVRVNFTPTTGRNYRLVTMGASTDGTYDIYNAKIIINQTSTTGITKLENSYLLANTLLSAGTSLQNFDTLFDPAEIYSHGALYYHEVNAANSSGSSVRLQTDPNGTPADITGTIVNPSNRTVSSAFSVPSTSQTIDVKATTNNGNVFSSGILSAKTFTTEDLTTPNWIGSADYCISAGCLEFDGTDDVIAISDNESINFGKKLNGGFTIQTWVRANTLGESNSGMIFSKGANALMGLTAGSTSGVADLYAEINLDNNVASLTVDDGITLNRWHLITLVYTNDSDDEISIYIDSVLKGTGVDGDGSPLTGTDTLKIGGAFSGQHFDGYIDEFKIYAKERTTAEIRSDYIKYSPTMHGTSAAFGNESTNFLSDGLVGYWKMNEISGVALDSSGNDVGLSNNGDIQYSSGKFGNSAELGAASNQYFSYGSYGYIYYFDANSSPVNDPESYWGDDDNLFNDSSTSTCAYNGYQTQGSPTTEYLEAGGTNSPSSGPTFTSVAARMYGQTNSTNQTFPSISFQVSYGDQVLGEGDFYEGPMWSNYVSLSAPYPGGWTWPKLQQLSLKTYSVSGGADNPSALACLGEVYINSGLSIPTPQVQSISFWVKPDNTSNYFARLSSDGAAIVSSSGTLSANSFVDPSIYVDGILQNTITSGNWQMITVTTETPITADELTIGSVLDSYYDGKIDEVRIYNRVLSADEVQQLYAWSPDSSGYWKMDENTGNTAYDSSGNDGTGTLSGGAKFTLGRYGSGVSLDGNNDFVTALSNASISPNSAVAVSAWINLDEQFSTSSPSNLGILDKGDYRLYLDKTDGKLHWDLNDGVSDSFLSIGVDLWGRSNFYAIGVHNGNLYMGGYFQSQSGITTLNNIGRYNDTTGNITAMGTSGVGTSGATAGVNSFASFNGSLYVGGNFVYAGGVLSNGIAKYDDVTNAFSAIGGATKGITAGETVETMTSYKDKLYLGGGFTTAGGGAANRIAKYDSTSDTFSSVGGSGMDGPVYALAVYNGNLYIGGNFDTADGVTVNNIARYNYETDTFSAIGGGTIGTSNYVTALVVYNGNLYVGGPFLTAGGVTVSGIAKYNDLTNTFSPIGQSPVGLSHTPYTFAVHNNDLFIGGAFTNTGGTALNYIARYNDTENIISPLNGSPVGIDDNFPAVTGLATYNGSLYFGGYVSTAGGVHTNEVGKYGSTAKNTVSSNRTSWEAGKWYHVAGVFVGNALNLYVDGTLENTSTGTTFALDKSDAPLLIGKTYGSQWPGGSDEAFKGTIDEVRIYDYPVAVKQITKDLDAEEPAPDSTLGAPISQWRFDEGGGTTVYDRTGNSRDLTLVTSPPTAQTYTTTGKFNKAYLGNGTTTYASRDDNTFVFGSDSFAVNAWFRSTSSSNPAGDEYILGRGGNTTAGYGLYFNTSGNLVFGVDDDTSWGPDTSASSPTDLYDGLWHNATAVKKDNTQIALYIDGRLVASETNIGASGTIGGDNTLVIGARGEDYSSKFNGSIDEVSIYNFDVGANEAKLLLNDSKTSQWGATSTDASGNPSNSYDREFCVPGDTATCESPIIQYRFEELTGNPIDSSTYKNDIDSSGGISRVLGKFGRAVYMGSSGSMYVTPQQSLEYVRKFTFSAWYYPFSNTAAGALISLGGSDAEMFVLNSDAYLNISPAGNQYGVTSTDITNVGGWQHWTMVYDGTKTGNSQRLTFFFNGVKQPLTYTGTIPASAPNAQSTIFVGDRSGVGGTIDRGTLDEVRIYNYPRTPQQINWEYNRGDARYLYKFNECSGNTANNSAQDGNGTAVGVNLTITPGASGNTTVGTCQGSANEMWYGGADGRFNGSLDFDGTDDYLASSNTVLMTTATSEPYNNFSFGAWVNPATAANSKTIIHKNNEFRLTTDSSGKPQCEIYFGSWQTPAVSSTALPTSSWSHVFCTYDGTNLKVYVNGVNTGTQAETDSVWSTSATALNIGRDSAGSGYFDGKIDEVSIHTMAFTDTMVKLLFNENSALRFGE